MLTVEIKIIGSGVRETSRALPFSNCVSMGELFKPTKP